MGSGALADIKKQKNKQIEKLDQEALVDAEEGAALQEDLELPLKLLSGWDPKDPGAPSNDGTREYCGLHTARMHTSNTT